MSYRPTLDEVLNYAEQWELSYIEPQDFYDYYEEKGWHKIKSWRMALRVWNQKAEANLSKPAPTIEEVREYAEQNDLDYVDEFFSFYDIEDTWGYIGDWREALKVWNKRNREGWD